MNKRYYKKHKKKKLRVGASFLSMLLLINGTVSPVGTIVADAVVDVNEVKKEIKSSEVSSKEEGLGSSGDSTEFSDEKLINKIIELSDASPKEEVSQSSDRSPEFSDEKFISEKIELSESVNDNDGDDEKVEEASESSSALSENKEREKQGTDTREKTSTQKGQERETSPTVGTKVIASGTFGTSPWEIDDSGELILRQGTLGTSTALTSAPWNAYRSQIETIRIDGSVIFGDRTAYLFSEMPNLVSITGLDRADTSNVTAMNHMFKNTPLLESVDMSNFNTSKVTNMGYMFENSGVEQLDLSAFDTSLKKALLFVINLF